MAKNKKVTGADIDWYLISIDRLKRIGLILLVVVLGLAGYWFYSNQKGNPKSNAESAITDAREALNALASSKDYPSHQTEFDRAKRKLDSAVALFQNGKYIDSQGAAVESQTISRGAMSGGERENDAQFLTVEGDVQFQKSASSDWKRAEVRAPLFNGDWVKTTDNSSAELIFSNGSLYTVGPNALLEIYSSVNPKTAKKTNAIQMQVGTVEVATTDDSSTVRTPGTQVVVDNESTTQVGVDPSKATSVISMKGSAEVQSVAGGEAVRLSSGQKVSAASGGALGSVKNLSLPPALMTPADNQVFQIGASPQVDFTWEQTQGAVAYQLQVSRSRLFTAQEINSRRSKPSASAKVTAEGAFYWRVASIGPDGEIGPFSPFRRFRVSGGNVTAETPGSDKNPPALTLKKPYNIGGPFYMIEGSTEPGATVFINDEEVDVESSGHFKKLVSFGKVGRNAVVVKAVDAAGNQTVQSETVLVEE